MQLTPYARTLLVLTLCLAGCSAFQNRTYTPSVGNPNPCVDFAIDAPEVVSAGAGLTATLTARNTCPEEISLPLSYDIHYDLIVVGLDGRIYWQLWQAEEFRPDILVEEPIKPGEALTFEAVWPGVQESGWVLGAGAYRLVGVLYSVDETISDVYTPETQNFEAEQPLTVVQ